MSLRNLRGSRIGRNRRANSSSAEEQREGLQRLCESLRKPVPDWWNSGWLNAFYLARNLGAKVATVEGWPWMAAELPVGRESAISLRDDITVHLKGQIDLVLAQNETAGFEGEKIWILDYKTGSTKELSADDPHESRVKRTTLQLRLHSLASAPSAPGCELQPPRSRNEKFAPQLRSRLSTADEIFRRLAECSRPASSGCKA